MAWHVDWLTDVPGRVLVEAPWGVEGNPMAEVWQCYWHSEGGAGLVGMLEDKTLHHMGAHRSVAHSFPDCPYHTD